MAKKKSKNNALSYIKYGAILLAIVGVIMTVLNFVKFGEEYGYTGIQVIFGYAKTTDLGITTATTEFLAFSPMALISVLLPLVGAFSVLSKNKIVRLIGALMMIAGTVLCFFMPNFVVFASEAQATAHSLFASSLGIGAILAGVMFGIGALCNLYAVVEK